LADSFLAVDSAAAPRQEQSGRQNGTNAGFHNPIITDVHRKGRAGFPQ